MRFRGSKSAYRLGYLHSCPAGLVPHNGNDAGDVAPDCCYGRRGDRCPDCDDWLLALRCPLSFRKLELAGASETISVEGATGGSRLRASSGNHSWGRSSRNTSSHPVGVRVLCRAREAVRLPRVPAPHSVVSLQGAQGVQELLRVAALRASPVRGGSVLSLASGRGDGAPVLQRPSPGHPRPNALADLRAPPQRLVVDVPR